MDPNILGDLRIYAYGMAERFSTEKFSNMKIVDSCGGERKYRHCKLVSIIGLVVCLCLLLYMCDADATTVYMVIAYDMKNAEHANKNRIHFMCVDRRWKVKGAQERTHGAMR